MEEKRAKPIHDVIDEGGGFLCNAVFCGNCLSEIFGDKCRKCGTITDENADTDTSLNEYLNEKVNHEKELP